MRLSLRVLALATGLVLVSSTARAADDGLASKLEEVRAQLEKEQAAIDAESSRFEAKRADKLQVLKDLEARREAVRRRLAKVARVRADEPTQPVAEQSAPPALSAEHRTELERQIERVVGAATTTSEQLQLYLGEVPGTDAAAQRLSELASGLSSEDAAARGKALSAVLPVVERVVEEAGRVGVRKASVWTARGQREEVRLLNVGHAAFAYEVPGSERVGVALSSPAEASGYRWSERVDPAALAAIRAAMSRVEAGGAALVQVPMDVSGQIRSDTVASALTPTEVFASGGYVMYPLAAVALIALLLILERAFVFYRLNQAGTSLPGEVLEKCRRHEYSDAEAACGRERGAIGRTLAALIRARGRGREAMEDTVQEQLLHELPRLEQRMGGIAILAAVAPLLGLLGTVTGIIQTFRVVHSFGNANPGLLAGGISEALTTTAAGLCIAIPVFLVHSVLRGRLDKILSDAERQAASLLNAISHEVQT